jgi:hypothetical protein
VSKKTVSFALPSKEARRREAPGLEAAGEMLANEAGEAGADAWVKVENDPTAEPFRLNHTFDGGSPTFVVDLAAERSLTEVIGLGVLAPFALGWFWFMNAIAGRPRF